MDTLAQRKREFKPRKKREYKPTNVIPVGTKFGRWEVIGPPQRGERGPGSQSEYPCLCECGTKRLVVRNNLVDGKTVSCGCYKNEVVGARYRTHGLSGHPLYSIWAQMKRRCEDPKNPEYHNYGGRGITVCSGWSEDFMVFYNWALSHGYETGLQIDRADNSLGYFPENVRFVSATENCRNMRTNRILTAWGESKNLSAWVEDARCVVGYNTLFSRLTNGWSPESAMTTPSRQEGT